MAPKVELVDNGNKISSKNVHNALTSSYNHHIRPLLDAVDRLRNLKVMQEGIQLPTIVVVGDQSSGKSSVLESLAGISLPRGQGICTRVPLIMRLQDNPSSSDPQLHLLYNNKTVPTSESNISAAIITATEEIAGTGKGISNTPLTLVVKKHGVPDLTMVDLPGITRVPVHGQPDDIYEQISGIIMEYITPKESIILNVLSAAVDFSICESIRMSQKVDRTGERTLAVVTKADKAPEGLLEKVTTDDVNIGLGYVCVRNRVGDESYDEARVEEKKLFDTHPQLSKIDKSIVGVPVLAQRLMQIQATGIAKCLPDIIKKINEKLSRNSSELDSMPQNLATVADAMRVFMQILSKVKESLRNIFIRGEYDEFSEDNCMHCMARLADMFNEYAKDLPSICPSKDGRFLMEELEVLLEAKSIGLPNFLPRTAFLTMLKRKINDVAHLPREFVCRIWGYIEGVVVKVLLMHSDNYPQLQASMRRALENIVAKMRRKSYDVVKEMMEMEMLADYTCNPDYMKTWSELMAQQDAFMDLLHDPLKPKMMNLKGIGNVAIEHLSEHSAMAEEAFDMRMRINAYWRSIVLRLVDCVALHVLFSVKKLVEEEMEREIVNEVVGNKLSGIEKMLEESPATAGKRDRLRKSIKLLEESKEVVAKIVDRIAESSD